MWRRLANTLKQVYNRQHFPHFLDLRRRIKTHIAPKSPHFKQDVDPFSRFCRAQASDRQTNTASDVHDAA